MDVKLAQFSDRQIALMMGSLNTGEINMRTRLLAEASYRLARAGGAAMTEEEDELLDDLMTAEFMLREHLRRQRRGENEMVRKGGRGESPEPLPARRRRQAIASTDLRLVVKR